MLQKKVIRTRDINEKGYFSALFVRPKKDGSFRVTLILKYLKWRKQGRLFIHQLATLHYLI